MQRFRHPTNAEKRTRESVLEEFRPDGLRRHSNSAQDLAVCHRVGFARREYRRQSWRPSCLAATRQGPYTLKLDVLLGSRIR